MLNNYKILNKALPMRASNYKKNVSAGDVLNIDGKEYTVDEKWFSKHNSFRNEIRLNPALLYAVEMYVAGAGASGLQIADGNANYVLTESLNEMANKIIATSYNPGTGEFKQCSRSPMGKKIETPLPIDGVSTDGVEVWYTLLVALENAKLVNGQFIKYADEVANEVSEILKQLRQNEEDSGNAFAEPSLIYRLQDVIYSGMQESSIPVSFPPNQAKLKEISVNTLKSGLYEPNHIISEGFKIFIDELKPKKVMTVKDYGDRFKLGIVLTPEQEARVPDVSDHVVTETALSIVHSILNTPHRCLMLGGPSGTGKTTDCMIAAALTGLPYASQSCSEGTDETDIVTKFIPNTGDAKPPEYLTRQLAEQIYDDLVFDPQTAVATLTGEAYNSSLTGPQCITKIINYFVENQRKNDKDFLMVPSEIVKGAQEPSIVEIQEVDLVGRPGVFPVLNKLLNEGVVDLADGTSFMRHPNSYFIFTANLTYEGCKELNQALKSRCQRIIMVDDLSEKDMVDRLTSSPNFAKFAGLNGYTVDKAKKLAHELVKAMTTLKNFVKDQQIGGSVCGYREYEAWFYESLAMKSARAAAESTIITHIALEEDLRLDVQTQLYTMLEDDET